jgi:hypothetical protein
MMCIEKCSEVRNSFNKATFLSGGVTTTHLSQKWMYNHVFDNKKGR